MLEFKKDKIIFEDEALRNGLQTESRIFSFEKKVVLNAAEKMVRAGVTEINLADSTGMATPYAIREMVLRFKTEFPEIRISLHLHDTRGLGLASLFAGYEAGPCNLSKPVIKRLWL